MLVQRRAKKTKAGAGLLRARSGCARDHFVASINVSAVRRWAAAFERLAVGCALRRRDTAAAVDGGQGRAIVDALLSLGCCTARPRRSNLSLASPRFLKNFFARRRSRKKRRAATAAARASPTKARTDSRHTSHTFERVLEFLLRATTATIEHSPARAAHQTPHSVCSFRESVPPLRARPAAHGRPREGQSAIWSAGWRRHVI